MNDILVEVQVRAKCAVVCLIKLEDLKGSCNSYKSISLIVSVNSMCFELGTWNLNFID